jgi:hypothetical protein
MDNIVVTTAGKAALPSSAKPLGKVRDLAWASWPAAHALDSAFDSTLRLAYLDEAEFRRETEGLRPAQAAEAMRKRSGMNTQYLFDMSDRIAAETGRIGAWIDNPAALDVHREGYYTGRFIYENSQDIEELIRDRVRIGTLEKELLSRGDCPSPLAERLRKRDSATALVHLEKAAGLLGQANADLKRQDSSPRILYAPKIFPWLAAKVASRDFTVDKVGKGYLIPQTPEEIAKLPAGMHPLIAFLDEAESDRAIHLLTPSQMQRRIAAIVAQGGVSLQDYLTEILDARLRMLATLRLALASAKFPLPPAARKEAESAYAQILGEARQAAENLLGPADPAQGLSRLAEMRRRIRILGRFSASSGEAGLIAWTQRSTAALEGKP